MSSQPTAQPVQGLSAQAVGIAFAAVSALLFGSKGIAIKIAYADGIDAETLVALRLLVALPFYIGIGAIGLITRKRAGKPPLGGPLILRSMALGMLGYWVASYGDFKGLEYVTAQYGRVVLFTYPLFVVVFGAMFFNQPIRLVSVLATGIGYVGVLVMFSEQLVSVGEQATIGTAIVTGAAIALAFFQLFAKGTIPLLGTQLFTCISMIGASLGVFAQFVVIHDFSDVTLTPRIIACALYLGIGATVLPSFMLMGALSRISPTANATVGMLSPVGTIFLADIILGERLTLVGWLGTALVIAGVSWFAFSERRR